MFELTSQDFTNTGHIPIKYTCDGKNTPPSLAWTGVPPDAKSLVLLMEDPDAPDPEAPERTFVHWVLYDLPAASPGGLPEGISAKDLPKGARSGKNDAGTTQYYGPNPPIGRHRYFFRLYALDTVLPDLGTPTKAKLLEAMEGHVLAETELFGFYEKAATQRHTRH